MQEAGIHIRSDVFVPQLFDDEQAPLSKWKRMKFASAKDPDVVYDPHQVSVVYHQPCSCGCDEPRVMETKSVCQEDLFKVNLDELLLTWSSVLDYRLEIGESGSSLELVVFPGEPMPKLPSFARLNIRPWDPSMDVPFEISRILGKKQGITQG